jgi:hypothetical protein
MNRAALIALLTCAAIAAAGCGSGNDARTNATSHTQQRTEADPAVALRRSVNVALASNYQLAVYVLWHNRVPTWAKRSTTGPALASLYSAARTRAKRGVRVRMLAHRRRVLQLQLDPSYARASAVILDWQRVQPSNPEGHALGHTVVLRERARYELRRVGKTQRFLVWKVALLR